MMNDPKEKENEDEELGAEYEEYLLLELKIKKEKRLEDALLLDIAAQKDEEEEREYHEG